MLGFFQQVYFGGWKPAGHYNGCSDWKPING